MRYRPLQLGLPGTPEVPDKAPAGDSTGALLCPGATVAHVTVAVAAVWLQFGEPRGGSLGSVVWQAPILLMPVHASFPEPIDAVRVWRYSESGEAPQVSITVA